MIPRFGSPPHPDRRYRVRPGAYAILPLDGSLLLTFQEAPIPEVQLPGGGIDPGEHALPALHREIEEETGWRVGPLRHVASYRRFTYMPEYDLWAEKLCRIFVGRPARAMGPPSEPGHSAVWASLPDAVRLLGSPGDRAVLSRAAKWLAL